MIGTAIFGSNFGRNDFFRYTNSLFHSLHTL